MKNKLIYILDDCQDVCLILTGWLRQHGEVKTFNCSTEFLEKVQIAPPHLCIIDQQINENQNGIDLLPKISSSNIPIIIISQDTGRQSSLKALRNGAVDYIHKPLVKEAIQLKVLNLIKLSSNEENLELENDLVLDEVTLTFKVNRQDKSLKITLTKKEYFILKKLLQHRQTNVSREELILYMENQLNHEMKSDRVIDYHICNIKKKLGYFKSIIKPTYGIGYRIE